jgi:hypothetical protein
MGALLGAALVQAQAGWQVPAWVHCPICTGKRLGGELGASVGGEWRKLHQT